MNNPNCLESGLEIVRIVAYPLSAVKQPSAFTRSRLLNRTKLIVNEPAGIELSLLPATASLRSDAIDDASGPAFQNAIQWQTADTSDATLEQLDILRQAPHHFIVWCYGGRRKLLYNDNPLGVVADSMEVTDEESVGVSLAVTSRLPVFSIME